MVVPYYSKEDIKTLKKMFRDYYTVKQIAKALNRSHGSVAQQIWKLGLAGTRDAGTVRMVEHHGHEILKYGKTPDKIRVALVKKRKADKRKAEHEKKERQSQAINALILDLQSLIPRNVAIRAAYDSGATMVQIGKVVGMTKQGVAFALQNKKAKGTW
jgi:hypothetical protein